MSSLFPDSDESIVAYCDGGSRGNPGPAGFGVYIQDSAGGVLAELSQYLGKRTNNFAEYSALLASLDFAITQGHPSLRVISDSELMVKQIKGQYRVNSPELRPLYEEAKRRIAQLKHFQIQHVLAGEKPSRRPAGQRSHGSRDGESAGGGACLQGCCRTCRQACSCASTSTREKRHAPRLRKRRGGPYTGR